MLVSPALGAASAAGISTQAISDAIHVLFLFSVYTRLADSLGWEVREKLAYYAGVATRLLTRGYA